MKRAWLVLLLLLVACTPKVVNFSEGYREMIGLDEKFDGDFREEILKDGGLVVPLENINDFSRALDSLEEDFSAMPDSDDKTALLQLLEARKEMLEAERYYQLFAAIGGEGLVKDTFTCSDIPSITKATAYMAGALQHGANATVYLDKLFIKYPEMTRPVLGINDKKIRFFGSDFTGLQIEITRNKLSVKEYCDIIIE